MNDWKNLVHQETANGMGYASKHSWGFLLIFNDKITIIEGLKLFSGN